jgi:hypothetical protein
LDRLKPDEFDGARLVAQGAYEAFDAAFAQRFQTTQDTFHLVLFAFGLDVADAVEFGAVNIAEREMKQQVAGR